jgi:hypothetical protein
MAQTESLLRRKGNKSAIQTVGIEQYGEEITPFLEKVGVISAEDDFEKCLSSAISGK